MPDDQIPNNPLPVQNNHEFTVIFKNGALIKLKELAVALEIPEHNLGDVVLKGLKVLGLAKNGQIIIEDKKDRMEIDVKKL